MLFLKFLLYLSTLVSIGSTTKSSKQILDQYSTSRVSSSNQKTIEKFKGIYSPMDHFSKKGDIKRSPNHNRFKRSLNTTEQSTTRSPGIIVTPPPFIPLPRPPPPLLPPPGIIPPGIPGILTTPSKLNCTGENSCQGRCSISTEWNTRTKFECHCDPDCYEVFNDCCADYVDYCGIQKATGSPYKEYNWSCEAVGHYSSDKNGHCHVGDGLWMVTQCPKQWLDDEIRMKCEQPTGRLAFDSSDLSRYIPVVDSANVTFRNYFCALCNSATQIDFWPVFVETSIIPPKNYTISKTIEFLLSRNAYFPDGNGPSRPKSTHGRRYCVNNVINSCSNGKTDNSCANGSTELVSSLTSHYKNIDCAFCQRTSAGPILLCFPGVMLIGCALSFPQPFFIKLDYSRAVDNREETFSISIIKESCATRGMFYDPNLEECVTSPPLMLSKSGYDRFLVYTWLEPNSRFGEPIPFNQTDFQTALSQLLDTSPTLVTDIEISTFIGSYPPFLLVSSTITLTPPQSLLISQYESKKQNAAPQGNLINLIFFKRPLKIIVNNINFTIFKTTDRKTETVCDTENSCSRRCSQNRTEWRNDLKFSCYCDPDCYEVFNDCCSDYESYCGTQTPTSVATRKYSWTCESIGYLDSKYCSIGQGIWMVSKCDEAWPDDQTRRKCEAPFRGPPESPFDFERYSPVVSNKNITFRNGYCALCNHIEQYEPWLLGIETVIIAPEHYNLTEKIIFLLRHGATFLDLGGPWRPILNQPRRYCITSLIDTCPVNETSNSCTDGPTSVVSAPNYANFKNLHCAICHGMSSTDVTCFPNALLKICTSFAAQSFSLVFGKSDKILTNEKQSVLSIRQTLCGKKGLIYDDQLQICRVNWTPPPRQNGQERFYVVAWFLPQSAFDKSRILSKSDFHKMLVDNFNVSDFQVVVYNVTFIPTTSYRVVESAIILAPEQSLEALSGNRDTNSLREKSLSNFIYFKEPLALALGDLIFTVVKTTSRPLACVGRREYIRDEYTLLADDSIYVNSTNTTYNKFEYFREDSQQIRLQAGNITVCENYKPPGCNTTQTTLSRSNFTVFNNLSIYRNETSILYHYGEYLVFPNNSIGLCDAVQNIARPRETIRDNQVLGWITVVGFILSIICLIFLLVTYIKFSHLRTLPGKNLINLAATILMFLVFWLIPGFSEVRNTSSLCTAIAVIEHYFILASFASMSVIAFHTCKVFAKNLPAPRPSEEAERKLFAIYSSTVWLVPAVLVAIFFILDKEDIFSLGYGNTDICWLTETEAHTYFVATPIGLLLLFNAIAFAISVFYLRKHGKNKAAKQASGRRASQLSIYIKLSTLMGFQWLFALLAIVAEPSTVFWYLFVIFTSLQGVFISFAFVLNAKTFELYRKVSNPSLYNRHDTQSTSNTANRKTPRIQDTSL